MDEQTMREFWDERAEEDAFFFVDSRSSYGDPDQARFWAGGAADLDRLLSSLEVSIGPEDDVVEIGCGVGRLTSVIAARARRVQAIDVSQRMLELARGHHAARENVTWVLGSGDSLYPVAEASADVCLSHVVFQHIPDPEITMGYVREMGRVLRPGGWAAFQVSNLPELHRKLRGLRRLRVALLARFGRGPRGQSDAAWRGSAVDLERLRTVAREAGLETERVSGEGTQWCLVLLRKR